MTVHHISVEEDLEQQFTEALIRQGIGSATANKVLRTLKARYNIPTRYYHSLEHAQYVASHVTKQKRFATHLDALLIAAWFHDVIYWPMADIDNEVASARFARHTLYLAGCTVSLSNLVGDLIISTQHNTERPDSIDGQILADADLVTLAAERPQYIINLQNIRKEYLHVPLAKFCEGHSHVMKQLQQRERIFWTDDMAERYETAARSNINWIIDIINVQCTELFTQ